MATEVQHPVDGRGARLKTVRWLAIVSVIAIVVMIALLFNSKGPKNYRLKMAAGDQLSHRYEMASIFVEEAAGHGLRIELIPSTGSTDTLKKLTAGEIDIAFIQGGLNVDKSLFQVASLNIEPLHLLVKPGVPHEKLDDLKGKRINLSTKGSGTRKLAQAVLKFAEYSENDYTDESFSYGELEKLPFDKLPDAVFAVSALPFSTINRLVEEHDFELVSLPFARSMALTDASLRDVVIPPFTYSVVPPMPAEELHTIGSSMMVVARADVPEEAVTRIMESLFESSFLMRNAFSGIEAQDVNRFRELPMHPGTVTYLRRNDPIIDGEFVEGLENLRSFIVSAFIAAFLAWRWASKRSAVGFEQFFDLASEIEMQALAKVDAGVFDQTARSQAHKKLSQLKNDVLEYFASGRLKGEEQLNSFLAHVTDIREMFRQVVNEKSNSAGNTTDSL